MVIAGIQVGAAHGLSGVDHGDVGIASARPDQKRFQQRSGLVILAESLKRDAEKEANFIPCGRWNAILLEETPEADTGVQ